MDVVPTWWDALLHPITSLRHVACRWAGGHDWSKHDTGWWECGSCGWAVIPEGLSREELRVAIEDCLGRDD